MVDVHGLEEPVVGRLVSVPKVGPSLLNWIVLRAGRGVAPGRSNEADIMAARAILRSNGISVAEVAERLKVSPSTLYRHLPGGRGAVG